MTVDKNYDQKIFWVKLIVHTIEIMFSDRLEILDSGDKCKEISLIPHDRNSVINLIIH